MVKASSLFQKNRRIGFHGLFHLHSGGALKNTEIIQNCWRPTLWKRPTRMEKKKDKICVGEKVQHWVQGLSSESDGCIPYCQICAYPTAICFHTKWPSATVFIRCTLRHIHPSLAACLLDCSFKQIQRCRPFSPPRRQRWSQVAVACLVFQNIPLMPRIWLCCGDNFPGLSLRRLFWHGADH